MILILLSPSWNLPAFVAGWSSADCLTMFVYDHKQQLSLQVKKKILGQHP